LLLTFVVSFLLAALREKKFKLRFSKIQLGLLGLGVWVFLSTLVTANTVDSQAAFFDGYFKSLVIFVLIYQTIRDERDYQTVVGSMSIAVFGLAVVALFNTFFVQQVARLELFGALKNSNDLAAMFIFILPFALRSLWRKHSSLFGILRDLVIATVILAGIWKAQSRAAYLALFCMAAVWLAYRFRKQKMVLAGGVVAAVLVLTILSGLQLGRESTDLEGSRQNRIGYWKAGVAMTLRNPLLGVGYGRFPYHFREYGASFTEYGQRTAHSSWILLVSEAGVPALVIFVTLFALAFHRAWQLAGVAPELLVALTGYGVAMSFLSHVYTLYPYILLALIFSYPMKEVPK
ncbi:MAG: O-antigen ligase family protein, partial [Proteobacteria bacterium]